MAHVLLDALSIKLALHRLDEIAGLLVPKARWRLIRLRDNATWTISGEVKRRSSRPIFGPESNSRLSDLCRPQRTTGACTLPAR
jgi:hypothetical protein